MGISTRPVFVIFAGQRKYLCPLAAFRTHTCEPLRTLAQDGRNIGECFYVVNQSWAVPQTRETAGYGGRGRGVPRLPSIEAINAVSSPQTNAPAPSRISISKLNGVPQILLPRKPLRLASRNGSGQAADSGAGIRRAHTCSLCWRLQRTRRWPSLQSLAADRSETLRSINAPGSPSSPLQMTYFGEPTALATVPHFKPVG